MLHLIKGRPMVANDPYLQCVERSRELAVVREVAIWWRTYHVERTCFHTARLMNRLGLLGRAVAEFYSRAAASPFAEEVGRQFVAEMTGHSDPLVASMAQFEAALLKVREGSARRYGIEWDRNPNDVFRALEKGGELPESEGMPCYYIEVAADIPDLVCCTRFA